MWVAEGLWIEFLAEAQRGREWRVSSFEGENGPANGRGCVGKVLDRINRMGVGLTGFRMACFE